MSAFFDKYNGNVIIIEKSWNMHYISIEKWFGLFVCFIEKLNYSLIRT